MPVTVRVPGDFTEDFPTADAFYRDGDYLIVRSAAEDVTLGVFAPGKWEYAVRTTTEPADIDLKIDVSNDGGKITKAIREALRTKTPTSAEPNPDDDCTHTAVEQHEGWRRCVNCGHSWTPDDESEG